MFEKVNPAHPDKLADRIAGALVDLAYEKEENPRIAVEVLLGHGHCHILAESSVELSTPQVQGIVQRVAGDLALDLVVVPQDPVLAKNQSAGLRCGDNGIFKGVPITEEQESLSEIARKLYRQCPFDGKYILDREKLVLCQSHVSTKDLQALYPNAIVNPGFP